MTNEEREMLRSKILQLLEKGREEVRLLKENTKPVSPENAIGRVSRMDAINNKGVADAALRNKNNKMQKLELALRDIDKAGFGICNSCKGTIQQARLLYMPESTKCVRCASR